MDKTLAQISTKELEEIVVRTIDRRLDVWFTQLIDAWTGLPGEEEGEVKPEFADSLKRALEQARSGEGVDLKTFREQIGR